MEKKRTRSTDSMTSFSSNDQLKGGRLRWTARDVMNLMLGVSKYGHAWSTIIKQYDFRGRNAKAISDKFYSIAGKGDRRSVYSKEEEERLIQGVKRFGCRSWRKIRELSDEDLARDGEEPEKWRCLEVDDQYDDDSAEDMNSDDEGDLSEHDHNRDNEKFHRFQQLLLAVAADQLDRGREVCQVKFRAMSDLDDQQQRQVQQFLLEQQQQQVMQQIISKITDTCTEVCSSWDKQCLANCTLRYLDTSAFVMSHLVKKGN